jgi:hypothetical protein
MRQLPEKREEETKALMMLNVRANGRAGLFMIAAWSGSGPGLGSAAAGLRGSGAGVPGPGGLAAEKLLGATGQELAPWRGSGRAPRHGRGPRSGLRGRPSAWTR